MDMDELKKAMRDTMQHVLRAYSITGEAEAAQLSPTTFSQGSHSGSPLGSNSSSSSSSSHEVPVLGEVLDPGFRSSGGSGTDLSSPDTHTVLCVEEEAKTRRGRKFPVQRLPPKGIVRVSRQEARAFASAAGFSHRRATPLLRTGVRGVHALIEYRRLAGDVQISCDQRALTMARTPGWDWQKRPTGIAEDGSIVLCCMCAEFMTLQAETWWEGRVPLIDPDSEGVPELVEFGFRSLSSGPVDLKDMQEKKKLLEAIEWSPHEVWCYCLHCKDDILRRRTKRAKEKTKTNEWQGEFCADVRLKNPSDFSGAPLQRYLRACADMGND